ncbi:hypothetical protein ACIHFE_12365 [Streptomyces sp. NPDC052396]|uniref:hypothetical protein n=1 Tax=Streptomyces sp. NPDC052396 TaxID=3365689 RepID=UPI0037D86920
MSVRSSFRTVPGVPRWASRAAHLAALTTLPSGLWRVAIAVGIPVGLGHSELVQMDAPGWGSVQLVGLSLFAEVLALLSLGLVQPWGEVWPRWLPLLRGRRVPVAAAVVPAALGALAVTVYGVLFVWTSLHGDMDVSDWGYGLIVVLYSPMLLWGPLLGAVTVHYHARRTA